jgi:glycerate-2-kinase
VPHDRIEAIASGPTVPDPTTFGDAQEALRRLELWARVPRSVHERIERGVAGAIPETPKPGDPLFARARTVLVGTNRTAVAALVREGERRGEVPGRAIEVQHGDRVRPLADGAALPLDLGSRGGAGD